MPPTWDDFQAYVLDMVEGEDLHVTDEARDLAVEIVMRPPVPRRLRPVLELANQITIGLLPPRLRRQYGFAWDPVRAVAIRGGAEYAKRFVVPFLPERLRVVRSARRACVACASSALRTWRPCGAFASQARRVPVDRCPKRSPGPPGYARSHTPRPRKSPGSESRDSHRTHAGGSASVPTAATLTSLDAAVSAARRAERSAEDPAEDYRGCIPPSSDTTWLVM